MKDFIFACNVLLPIVLVILVGYVIKKIKLFDNNFFKLANKLCFRICIPILLFKNVYDIDSLSNINWAFIRYICIGIVILFIIGAILVKFTIPDDKQKGVILQAFFRSNYAIVGIPLAANIAAQIAGADVKVINGNAAIASAFSIPLFNILAVIALSIFDKGDSEEQAKGINFKKIGLNILKNPLIHGVVLGIIVVAIKMIFIKNGSSIIDETCKFKFFTDDTFLYDAIANVAIIATPLALIALGGQFEFKAVSKLKFQLTYGLILRVIIVPLLGLTIAYLLGFRVNEFPALIGIFATPVAVSSVPMAAEMGQDDELAGQLVVWTTILTTISLMVILIILKAVGAFNI